MLTHGNGPQVGLLALQNEAYTDVHGYPLDVLDAETEGMVGYLLEQELGRHLPPDRLATLLTQIVVDPDDYAFANPTKFVGPVYEARDACLHGSRSVAGRSPLTATSGGESSPLRSPNGSSSSATIEMLVDHGVTVTCAGGGGIPVVPDGHGGLRGIEAVIDKDLSASLLARELHADALLLLTDVEGVYAGWGTPHQRLIRENFPGSPPAARPRGGPDGAQGRRGVPVRRGRRLAGSDRQPQPGRHAPRRPGRDDRPPPRGLNRSEVEDQVDHTSRNSERTGSPEWWKTASILRL